MKIKLSVIMSVCNGERYLDEAMQSILNQTFREFEFIIVDDASTDSSRKIIKHYQRKDGRIELIQNRKNIGLTRSLNRGIKCAKTDIIARMDADDISLKNRLKEQYDFLNNNKDYYLCASERTLIDEDGRTTYSKCREVSGSILTRTMEQFNLLIHSSIMFRTGIWYREKFRYAQDYDLYLRLITQNKKIHVIKKSLIKYRLTSCAITTRQHKQQELFAKKALEFYFERRRNGHDSYENWDPTNILKESNPNPSVLFLEESIENALKKNRTKAKQYLNEYNLLKEKSSAKLLVYSFFYKFPKIYKMYRKIVYGDALK